MSHPARVAWARRWPRPRYRPRRIVIDDRLPEERRCAIVLYDVAFALWQEWHAEAVFREKTLKLRAIRATFRRPAW